MAQKDYTIFIPPEKFSTFDKGKETEEQRVYHAWTLQKGDILNWRSATGGRNGTAKVTTYRSNGQGNFARYQKVS